LNAYAEFINDRGGIGCRKLIVRTWDSKLSADETKNGLIDACASAFALVGGNALFNPDMGPVTGCRDKAGATTGLPDLAALAVDVNQQCNATTFTIQPIQETCPIAEGESRPVRTMVGPVTFLLKSNPNLHGLYLVAGDLPSGVQGATFPIEGMRQAGIKWDGTPKVSGRDEQSAYTPRIQIAKANNSNFVYGGSNDRAMISMRKEAKAQGLDSVKVWLCGGNCYTRTMLDAGGTAVEGTYMWTGSLPFEEADSNKEVKAYVEALGDKKDSFGAYSWMAGVAFKSVIDTIVAKSGPNGITRAAFLEALAQVKDFTANGFIGATDLRGFSPCFAIMQIKGGKWARVYPTKKGTFDCDPANVVSVTLDPVVEAAKIK
jgi:hypothetical protein